jgi:hypothetical protein
MGFFEIGSFKVFAWAGFEPRSSWSLPLEYPGLQASATVPIWALSFMKLLASSLLGLAQERLELPQAAGLDLISWMSPGYPLCSPCPLARGSQEGSS